MSDPWTTDKIFGDGPLSDSTFSGVSVSLTTRLGDNAVLPLPTTAEECMSPASNDGEVPPATGPGSAGAFLSPIASVELDVVGPSWNGELIVGDGEFSTDSDMHRYFTSSGKLVVDAWRMVEQGPTTIGTSQVEATVDSFGLRLIDPLTPTKAGGRHVVSPGVAMFSLSATVDGQGYPLQATNATQLQFIEVNGGVAGCPSSVAKCLQVRAFTIVYEDDTGTWELDVAAGTWAP